MAPNYLSLVFNWLYYQLQFVVIWLFRPTPPKDPNAPLSKPNGKIAVIGCGLTGISSAAHCLANNFEVTMFESKDKIGGIWANVNSTSGLQLNSILYRFHPAVHWKQTFPHKEEIVDEITNVWKMYGLASRTRFNTAVTQVTRDPSSTVVSQRGHGRWIINGNKNEVFDAVIVTVGTCGKPNKIHFPGTEEFKGKVVHSSELDNVDLKGKQVVVVGGGASGVEAVELAVQKEAEEVVLVSRDDKWILPRNIVFDTLIAMQPFGREMPLSFIPEQLLKKLFYRDLQDIAPRDKGLFEGTPIVNDEFLHHVRQGRCTYIRGDGSTLTDRGVRIKLKDESATSFLSDEHKRVKRAASPAEGQKHAGSTKKDEDLARELDLKADVVVLATGFERPSIDFLPKDLFPENYQRPNLYLQNFATEDWSILMTNASYMNAIGTVGHFHIGIYTRILLVLLLDKSARPTPRDMRLWVDMLRFIKGDAKGGALGFFTYMELTVWLFFFHIFRPDRLRWMFFIMQGWSFSRELRPARVVKS